MDRRTLFLMQHPGVAFGAYFSLFIFGVNFVPNLLHTLLATKGESLLPLFLVSLVVSILLGLGLGVSAGRDIAPGSSALPVVTTLQAAVSSALRFGLGTAAVGGISSLIFGLVGYYTPGVFGQPLTTIAAAIIHALLLGLWFILLRIVFTPIVTAVPTADTPL